MLYLQAISEKDSRGSTWNMMLEFLDFICSDMLVFVAMLEQSEFALVKFPIYLLVIVFMC